MPNSENQLEESLSHPRLSKDEVRRSAPELNGSKQQEGSLMKEHTAETDKGETASESRGSDQVLESLQDDAPAVNSQIKRSIPILSGSRRQLHGSKQQAADEMSVHATGVNQHIDGSQPVIESVSPIARSAHDDGNAVKLLKRSHSSLGSTALGSHSSTHDSHKSSANIASAAKRSQPTLISKNETVGVPSIGSKPGTRASSNHSLRRSFSNMRTTSNNDISHVHTKPAFEPERRDRPASRGPSQPTSRPNSARLANVQSTGRSRDQDMHQTAQSSNAEPRSILPPLPRTSSLSAMPVQPTPEQSLPRKLPSKDNINQPMKPTLRRSLSSVNAKSRLLGSGPLASGSRDRLPKTDSQRLTQTKPFSSATGPVIDSTQSRRAPSHTELPWSLVDEPVMISEAVGSSEPMLVEVASNPTVIARSQPTVKGSSPVPLAIALQSEIRAPEVATTAPALVPKSAQIEKDYEADYQEETEEPVESMRDPDVEDPAKEDDLEDTEVLELAESDAPLSAQRNASTDLESKHEIKPKETLAQSREVLHPKTTGSRNSIQGRTDGSRAALVKPMDSKSSVKQLNGSTPILAKVGSRSSLSKQSVSKDLPAKSVGSQEMLRNAKSSANTLTKSLGSKGSVGKASGSKPLLAERASSINRATSDVANAIQDHEEYSPDHESDERALLDDADDQRTQWAASEGKSPETHETRAMLETRVTPTIKTRAPVNKSIPKARTPVAAAKRMVGTKGKQSVVPSEPPKKHVDYESIVLGLRNQITKLKETIHEQEEAMEESHKREQHLKDEVQTLKKNLKEEIMKASRLLLDRQKKDYQVQIAKLRSQIQHLKFSYRPTSETTTHTIMHSVQVSHHTVEHKPKASSSGKAKMMLEVEERPESPDSSPTTAGTLVSSPVQSKAVSRAVTRQGKRPEGLSVHTRGLTAGSTSRGWA
ncbi:hypothetical protein HDU93_001176 [Gonapodya sp. JEL0774]|nr:hypothetical protein HDU93_001176 [Gonapodya sp. JEL0774]